MPAEQRIAENLAFINWTVLTGLAVGAFGAVVLGRLRTDATRGFLVFTAFCASVFGLLAYLSDTALPATVPGSAIVPDPAFDQPRRLALILFTVLAFAYGVAIARRSRAPAIGIGGLIAGVAGPPAAPRIDRGHRRRLRRNDPRPLVSRDAEAP